jgi:hypothetical protein
LSIIYATRSWLTVWLREASPKGAAAAGRARLLLNYLVTSGNALRFRAAEPLSAGDVVGQLLSLQYDYFLQDFLRMVDNKVITEMVVRKTSD